MSRLRRLKPPLNPFSAKDLWLSAVNPLRGITMSRVAGELENGMRGDYVMLQWLYHYVEKRDATLRGARRRIRASLQKLDWDIKIRAGLSAEFQAAAETQKTFLTDRYEKIENLREALGHLADAEFRGFSHCEKIIEGGIITRLECVPQWHWCRQGIYGDWLFQETPKGGLDGDPIEPTQFLIREVSDPINEIALICFVRKSLSQKDWDSFIARYGIPFIYWMMSDTAAAALANDPAKLNEYMATMRGIGADGEGVFPGGTLSTIDSGSGSSEQFSAHLRYNDEQIVMAATSGKLTMLNDPSGLGGGNSSTHADTFDELAVSLAMQISEIFQDQLDKEILNAAFPGMPHLVYFELAAKDADDITALVAHAKTLFDAGIQIDLTDLAERTGYKLTQRGMANAERGMTDASVTQLNRADERGVTGVSVLSPEEKSARDQAAALLDGFSAFASNFLDKGFPDLAPLLANSVVTSPS
jgi:phage gp29-like protein